MTDITELAQKIKAAAIAVARDGHTDDEWFYYLQCVHHKNVIALVEALEKAQQRIIELENYAEAEAVGADKAAEDGLYWMKRCKELESRTVKLPQRHSILLREDFNEDYHTEMAYKADEVQASLRAAGIKVEAE